ncbi:MAG: DUF4372 domain-containing protein [Planctomycetota bacterium]
MTTRSIYRNTLAWPLQALRDGVEWELKDNQTPHPGGTYMVSAASLFAQMLSLVSRRDFARAVGRREAEKAAKGFSCWDQFVAMLFCQLAQARCTDSGTRNLLRAERFRGMGFQPMHARPGRPCYGKRSIPPPDGGCSLGGLSVAWASSPWNHSPFDFAQDSQLEGRATEDFGGYARPATPFTS